MKSFEDTAFGLAPRASFYSDSQSSSGVDHREFSTLSRLERLRLDVLQPFRFLVTRQTRFVSRFRAWRES